MRGREPSKSARSEKVPASAWSQAGWGELWCVSYTSDFVGTPGKGAGFSYSLTASVVSQGPSQGDVSFQAFPALCESGQSGSSYPGGQ